MGRMRSLIALVVLLGACSHTSVQYSSGGGVTSTSSSVSIGYSGQGSAAAWALIGIGLIAAEYAGSAPARERGLEPAAPPPQPMSAGRRVNEVDCTRPIADWTANLRCR